jgi:hypothetical protein
MHPAHHEVEKSRKRREAMVEGRARGGKLDRPGKKRADGGDVDPNDFSPDGLRAMYARTPDPKVVQQEKDRLIRHQKASNLDELAEKRGGEVKAAWDHVRRAYGGLVGGASENKDSQSISKPLEDRQRLGIPLLSTPERKEGGGIHIKPSHKGELHRDLGVKQGAPISEAKMEHAKKDASPAEMKRITFAENARKWNK